MKIFSFSSKWQPLLTCSFWELQMWLVYWEIIFFLWPLFMGLFISSDIKLNKLFIYIYILDTDPLAIIALFANIFPHSILLMVFFVVQKLLSLTRSNLFETLCTSYTWISISSFRFLKFQHNFLKYISILLSSPSETNIMQKWGYNVLRDICFLNCFFVFLSGILTGWFPLFYLPDCLCVPLYQLVCYSFLLMFFFFNFSYWIIYFSLGLYIFWFLVKKLIF